MLNETQKLCNKHGVPAEWKSKSGQSVGFHARRRDKLAQSKKVEAKDHVQKLIEVAGGLYTVGSGISHCFVASDACTAVEEDKEAIQGDPQVSLQEETNAAHEE